MTQARDAAMRDREIRVTCNMDANGYYCAGEFRCPCCGQWTEVDRVVGLNEPTADYNEELSLKAREALDVLKAKIVERIRS